MGMEKNNSKVNMAGNSGKGRAQFATKLGVIAATVGSAVGLGNIWRFPYEAGMHGGGAFLLVYVLFVIVLGIPVICAEFVLGRASHQNAAGAFRVLGGGKLWPAVGYMGILSSFLILGFYSVVAGWTLDYIFASVSGSLSSGDSDVMHQRFDAFTHDSARQLIWTGLFLAINFLVISRGVQKGIEKISNLLMPLLFVILIAFCVNALFMPKAAKGFEFLFRPDFSQLTPKAVLGAMGQAFFSLSVGMGVLMTYASYFSKETPLIKTASTTALLDTMVAVMAGMIIFPAVFSFGQEPTAGPRLVFEVLPAIFSNMPAGMLWSTLFFILLFVASLTSTISLSETVIAYCQEDLKMSRGKATLCEAIGVCVLSALSALSFGPLRDFHIFGMTFFDFLDFITASVLMPLGGMFISIYAGWKLKKSQLHEQLQSGERKDKFMIAFVTFCLRYMAPVAIGAIFVFGLL